MAHSLAVPEGESVSRRRLLSVGVLGLGGVIGLIYTVLIVRYLIPAGGGTNGSTENVGAFSSFKQEVPTQVPLGAGKAGSTPTGGAWIVTHANNTVTAFDMHCTHLSCPYQWAPPGGTDGVFACPCHGSVFHKDGTVLNGPAFNPLHKRAATVEGGNVMVGDIIS